MKCQSIELVGKTVGKYKVVESIGEGEFSLVYKAVGNGKDIAVKLLKPDLISDYIDDRIRFKREIETVSKLEHPGIVKYYDYGEYNEIPYMVTEYVKGQNMYELLLNQWSPSIKEAVRLTIKIAEALSYMHSKGIIHKDLKPGNIMLINDFRDIKLTDFGLAQLIELSKLKNIENLMKTFAYMSPEVTGMLRRPVDERSDLYSLGVILYRLLTGRLPFFDTSMDRLLYLHVAMHPIAPEEINPQIPSSLSSVVMKLLQKEPDKRYQSAEGLIYDLKSFLTGRRTFTVGQRDRHKKIVYKTKLFGREKEIKLLRDLFNRCVQGDSAFCVIIGEPGVGKTSLLEELTPIAVEKDALLLKSTYQKYESATPYQCFKNMLEQYVKHFLNFDEKLQKIEGERLRKEFGGVWRYVASLNPLANNILQEKTWVGVLESEEEQNRFLTVCARLFCNLTQGAKLFVIDNFQWADEGSIELLRRMLWHMPKTKTMVVVATRPVESNLLDELVSEAQKAGNQTETIVLRNLRPSSFKKMLEEILEPGHDKLFDSIYQKARGNPLHGIVILRNLIEEKGLKFSSGRWKEDWNVIKKLLTPVSAVDKALREIGKLPKEQKEFLKACSVMGTEFSPEAVFELFPEKSAEKVISLMDQAVDKQILTRDRKTRRVFFVHDRVRDAFYNMLSEGQRKKLHLKAGLALEKIAPDKIFEITHHFIKAGDVDKSVKYALEAARIAAGRYANRDAINYYKHVLNNLKRDDPDYYKILEELGECHRIIGEYKEAVQLFKSALPHQKNELDKASVLAKLGTTLFQMGDVENSIQVLEEALKELHIPVPSKSGLKLYLSMLKDNLLFLAKFISPIRKIKREDIKTSLIIDIHMKFGYNYYFSNHNLCLLYGLKTLNYLQNMPIDNTLFNKFRIAATGPILSWAGYKIARKYLEATEKRYVARVDDELVKGFAYTYRCMCEQAGVNQRASAKAGKKAVEILDKLGEKWELAVAYDFLSRALYEIGNVSECLKYSKAFLEAMEEIGPSRTLSWAYYVNAYAQSLAKEWDNRLIELARKSVRVATSFNDVAVLPKAYDALCMALYLNKSYDKAIEGGEKGVKIFEKADAKHWWASRIFGHTANAYFEKIMNHPLTSEEVHAILRRTRYLTRMMWKWGKRFKVYFPFALTLLAKQKWFEGDKKSAFKLFNKSLRFSKKYGFKLMLAHTYLNLGRLTSKEHRLRKASIEYLNKALALFEEMGATSYVKFVKELLETSYKEKFIPSSRLKIERDLNTIIAIATYISSTLDLEELLHRIVEKCMELIGAQRGTLFLYPESGGNLEVKVVKNISDDEINSEQFTQIIRQVEHTEKPVLIEEKSILCLPIMYKKDLLGVLYFDNQIIKGLFSEREKRVLEAICRQAAVSIENAFLYKRAITDALTGLYNRGFFENYLYEQIKQAQRYGNKLSILMIDIDDFKKVNDLFGHPVGDSVLKELAMIFRKSVRGSDLIARYGGEEFVIVLPHTSLREAVQVASKLREAVANHAFKVKFKGKSKKLKLTVSIGVAEWNPGLTRAGLIEKADLALYKAKEMGKNRVQYC